MIEDTKQEAGEKPSQQCHFGTKGYPVGHTRSVKQGADKDTIATFER
jgi:hypothetical protein